MQQGGALSKVHENFCRIASGSPRPVRVYFEEYFPVEVVEQVVEREDSIDLLKLTPVVVEAKAQSPGFQEGGDLVIRLDRLLSRIQALVLLHFSRPSRKDHPVGAVGIGHPQDHLPLFPRRQRRVHRDDLQS